MKKSDDHAALHATALQHRQPASVSADEHPIAAETGTDNATPEPVARVEVVQMDPETVAAIDAEIASEDGTLNALIGPLATSGVPVLGTVGVIAAGFPDSKAKGVMVADSGGTDDPQQSSGEASPFGPLSAIGLPGGSDEGSQTPDMTGGDMGTPPQSPLDALGQTLALPAPIAGDQLMTANAFFLPST